MLDDIQQIVTHLEESLRVIEENGKDEILLQPELLEKMNEVARSLIQVTRSLQNIQPTYTLNALSHHIE